MKRDSGQWRRSKALYERMLRHVAGPDAMVLPSAIGVVAGIVTGLGMVLFRLLIEASQEWVLGPGNLGAFETLSPAARLLLLSVGPAQTQHPSLYRIFYGRNRSEAVQEIPAH